MEAEPDSAFTVGDLCWRVFPTIGAVERKHRVSVLRALEKVAERSDGWRIGLIGARKRGAPVALYNSRSRESVTKLLAHGLRLSTTAKSREVARRTPGDRGAELTRRKRSHMIDALLDQENPEGGKSPS